ncbi:hypothetical protein GBA52_021607 [Prunus armeniaca]|nr:hypothetical protein GBA52_021607 [Prunus armeniaca]
MGEKEQKAKAKKQKKVKVKIWKREQRREERKGDEGERGRIRGRSQIVADPSLSSSQRKRSHLNLKETQLLRNGRLRSLLQSSAVDLSPSLCLCRQASSLVWNLFFFLNFLIFLLLLHWNACISTTDAHHILTPQYSHESFLSLLSPPRILAQPFCILVAKNAYGMVSTPVSAPIAPSPYSVFLTYLVRAFLFSAVQGFLYLIFLFRAFGFFRAFRTIAFLGSQDALQ